MDTYVKYEIEKHWHGSRHKVEVGKVFVLHLLYGVGIMVDPFSAG